jgi:hypothetical protein
MNLYKRTKIPSLIQNELQKRVKINPRDTLVKVPNDRVASLDILALHERANKAQATDKWQGGDREDRRQFVELQKAKLGNSLKKITDLSTKRTTHGAQQFTDLPVLEFRGYFHHLESQTFKHTFLTYSVEEHLKTNLGLKGYQEWHLANMKYISKVGQETTEAHAEVPETPDIKFIMRKENLEREELGTSLAIDSDEVKTESEKTIEKIQDKASKLLESQEKKQKGKLDLWMLEEKDIGKLAYGRIQMQKRLKAKRAKSQQANDTNHL